MRILSALLCFVSSALLSTANAETHEFNWTLTWKTVNPDGLKNRPVVAINDQWPLPVIRVNMGDRIIANVFNNLTNPNSPCTIHWHGLFQEGTNDMDGPGQVVQCQTASGYSFTYNFTVDQPGTYWYHTHVDAMYPDGWRQMLLVDNDGAWFEGLYDEELVFSLSDWYHELTRVITDTEFLSLYNPTGAEPVPQSLLFNETVGEKFHVKPNTTYRIRLANIGAFSAFIFYIPGSNFTIVEADGVYTEPSVAESLYIATAQRYSILFKTGPDPTTSYPMVMIADQSLYDVIPPDLGLNMTSWLVTSDDAECRKYGNEEIYHSGLVDTDKVDLEEFSSDNIQFADDFQLVPYDRQPRLPDPSEGNTITVKVVLTNLLDGVNYAFFDNISYTAAKVPTLYTVLSAPNDSVAMDPIIYGSNTHSIVLNHNEVYDLVLNNFDSGRHPFHMHGHTFQVLVRAPSKGSENDDDYFPYDPDAEHSFPEIPMRRDTVVVEPYSHFVIRFRANNPGVWLFHCHIDWHLTQGLVLTLVEAPLQIRQNMRITDAMIENCRNAQIPYEGNAAANVKDFTDLTGENRQAKNLPSGFTGRGIVALVFSIICAFVGMAFLIWYGLSDTPIGEAKLASEFVHEPVPADNISERFQDD